MSNKRQATDDIDSQPRQRQRVDQAHLPTLLLQIWPQLVCDYREARDEANAQVRVLRSVLDENVDELAHLRESLSNATEEIEHYSRLTLTLSAIINDIVMELPPVRRRIYNVRYQSAVTDFDATAIIDLTADEELEE